MKKLFFLLSVLMMMTFVCTSNAEGFNLSLPDGEYIFDVSVLDENTIAVLTDLNLYKVDTQLGFQTKLGSRLEGSIDIYCLTDGGIYSSIPSEQPYDTLYHFNEKTSEWEPFANIPMEMGNEYYGHIIKGVWVDECFYFLEYMEPDLIPGLMHFGLDEDQALAAMQHLLEFEAAYGQYADYYSRYAGLEFGQYAALITSEFVTPEELDELCANVPILSMLASRGKGGGQEHEQILFHKALICCCSLFHMY